MKRPTALLCALGVSALAGVALAQDSPSSQQTTTTKQTTTQISPDGSKVTTIEGKVVRYEPGKTIVLVGPDSREVSYMLTDRVQVPTDVQVGREVSLTAEPSPSGPAVVTKITTTSITPEGNIKKETETRSMSSSAGDLQAMSQSQTQTRVTTITGTVSAYEPGRSVTFVTPDKKTVVYTIEPASVVPSDLAVGGTYSIETTTSGGTVVKKITTTKITKSTTVQPQ
jgi:hypothetical protein